MLDKIRKRNGSVENFVPEKITSAIFKAAVACEEMILTQHAN